MEPTPPRGVDESHPVTIVGASAAGLFTAYLLARQRIPVQLYEQQEEIGPPARSLIVTGYFTRALGFPPGDVDASVVVNRIHGFLLHSQDTSAHITLREPDLVIERSRFLRFLADQARRAGARIITGHRLEAVEPDEALPALIFRDRASGATEEVRASTLIGADGVTSRVARAVNREGAPLVSIWQARVALPPGSDPHTVEIWFDRADTRFFYWLIPDSPRTGVLGLVDDDHAQAKAHLQNFLRRQNLEPLDYQLALVPLHAWGLQPWGRFGHADVFLVGDAAAQVKVTTVGGVVSGLRGAGAVARAIRGQSGYAAELRTLRRELDLHLLVRQVLDRFDDADYNRLLKLLGGSARRVLASYNRDELVRGFWRMAWAEPRWAILAARALMRSLLPGRRRLS